MPQGPGSGPQRQAPRVHYLLSYRAGAGDSISGLHKIWAVKPGKIYKNDALRREGAAPPLRGRKAGNCATARQGAAAPSQARLSALICNDAPPGAKRPRAGHFCFTRGARRRRGQQKAQRPAPGALARRPQKMWPEKASFPQKQRRPAQGPAAVENKAFLHPRQNKGGRLFRVRA